MSSIPSRRDQIVQVHAAFIVGAVEAIGRGDGTLEPLLAAAGEAGWHALVAALRAIDGGQRDTGLLAGLDDEDRVIAEAVLAGLRNPATLPDPDRKPEPTLAAPGLAQMLHSAARGNAEALRIVADMAEQMNRAGGPMAQVAARFRPLLNGERDSDRLCRGLDGRSEGLLVAILAELGKLEIH